MYAYLYKLESLLLEIYRVQITCYDNLPFVSFRFRHILELVSCKMLICCINVVSSLLLSDWFFKFNLSEFDWCAVSSSELLAKHGSLNLNEWKKKEGNKNSWKYYTHGIVWLYMMLWCYDVHTYNCASFTFRRWANFNGFKTSLRKHFFHDI